MACRLVAAAEVFVGLVLIFNVIDRFAEQFRALPVFIKGIFGRHIMRLSPVERLVHSDNFFRFDNYVALASSFALANHPLR